MTPSPSTDSPSPQTTVICVTPVRNEAWILERFLSAVALWADHIVIADQGSTDGSREIAAGFEKVRLVDNDAPAYDEGARQRLLLKAAREVPGRRLIVALDADEMLSPTWWDSEEWAAALAAEPGTVFSFDWVNVLPDQRAYVPPEKIPFAFLDDGSQHGGQEIHSTRVPVGPGAAIRPLDEMAVLHLQFTDWRRMKSKQRWYQCWERLNHEGKRPVQIYRQYHRMDAFPDRDVRELNPLWLSRYRELGVDILVGPSDEPLWWDEEVIDWIARHGSERFRKLNIWDVDWREIALRRGFEVDDAALADPRGPFDRCVHRWLGRTQGSLHRSSTRWLQRLLLVAGW